jgi:hypothetical protein
MTKGDILGRSCNRRRHNSRHIQPKLAISTCVGRDIQSAEIRPLRRVSRRVNRSNLSAGIFELRGLARTIKSSKSRDHAPKSILWPRNPRGKAVGRPGAPRRRMSSDVALAHSDSLFANFGFSAIGQVDVSHCNHAASF